MLCAKVDDMYGMNCFIDVAKDNNEMVWSSQCSFVALTSIQKTKTCRYTVLTTYSHVCTLSYALHT